MKQDSDGLQSDRLQLNTAQIERHLKSAVDTLTPNVLDRIDLSTPQDGVPGAWGRDGVPAHGEMSADGSRLVSMERRMRGLAVAAAACFCVIIAGSGTFYYQYQNRKIDSVIGIDVNPSVELSINRKNRVLTADALNEDAEVILEDMDLKGVELNVAVNAVVGSMVTHGYLDEVDNAILVTVSNDSVSKATELRTSIVGDIEQTLEENQVQAVVYDQQVIEKDEMKALAEEYGISYGKAYFLKELIDQNQELTMDDMDELSSMTMEEIARKITEDSYALGEFADRVAETSAPETAAAAPETTAPETATAAPETTQKEPEPVTESESSSEADTAAETSAPETTADEEDDEEVEPDQVEIDYVDYEDGMVYVYFVTRVNWKNPTVSVRDEDGNSYSAMVDETSSDECSIEVSGLEGGKTYTFVLGGLIPRETGKATTVTGYFDKPEIAEEATAEDDEDETDDVEQDDDSGDDDDGDDNGNSGSNNGSDDRGNVSDGESGTVSDDGDGASSEAGGSGAGAGAVGSDTDGSIDAGTGGTGIDGGSGTAGGGAGDEASAGADGSIGSDTDGNAGRDSRDSQNGLKDGGSNSTGGSGTDGGSMSGMDGAAQAEDIQ